QGAAHISRRDLELMKNSGVQIAKYHTVFWWDLSRFDHRTHRKLLIIDGKTGFTGGVGIAKQWTGNADSPSHWRDMHYRIEGPVVAQLQGVFMDNWLKTRGEVLHGEGYFPALKTVG